jgi:hypothetical protein
MLLTRHDLEILDRVVVLVPIDVMDYFTAPKPSAEVDLHDHAVLVTAVQLLVCGLLQRSEPRLRVPVVRATECFRLDVGRVPVAAIALGMLAAHTAAALRCDIRASFNGTGRRRASFGAPPRGRQLSRETSA